MHTIDILKKTLHRPRTLLIQDLYKIYTDEILLSNSFNSSQI